MFCFYHWITFLLLTKLIWKNYYGDIFEGDAYRKLLEAADELHDKNTYLNVGILAILSFMFAFKAMNKMVDFCFSLKVKGPHKNID